MLDGACAGGYMSIETLIDVPEDCRGYNLAGTQLADPAPFNHFTKIAILKATRKDGLKAS